GARGAEADGQSAGLPDGEDGSGKTVTLNFAGDVIFASKVGELLKQKGYDYPYARLGGMFLQDDLSVINLETPVTDRGTEANKTFVFKSPPEALNALKAAGVDAVNLANNHTLDMGEQGLRDTLTNLSQQGIPFVGAGADSTQAYSAQYFNRKGMTIALLGFTRVIPEAGWVAGKGKPGVASAYDSGPALKAIAEARKKADIVAVIVHWGKERENEPNAVQQSLGRSFIDAGADLVIGGHPHVLQGLEPYKGKWIAYSTGNFIFTRSSAKTTWETAVFQAECSVQGQCSMKLTPFEAELGQPVPMSAADGQKLLRRVESLSSGKVEIDEAGRVTEAGR
uniref:CapA family protein n=1 Tax=Paenibacillus durus TaxID=44251 RepID=UPI000470495D